MKQSPESPKSTKSKNKQKSRNDILTLVQKNPLSSLILNDSILDTLSTNRSKAFTKGFNYSKSILSSPKNRIETDPHNDYKLLPFEDYKEELTKLLSGYKLESYRSDNSSGRGENSSSTNVLNMLQNKSMIKVNIERSDYKSQDEAKLQIEQNKKIFDKINKNIFLRQKFLYKESIKTMSEELPNLRVKVTNTFPKNKDFLQAQGNAEVKKVNNVSLSIFTNGIADMYGYYLYCSRFLPESREQFSICGDVFNYFIFGGCSTKNFNDLWQFDSTKFAFNKINSENIGPNARYGHTTTLFNRKIYLFGGKIKLNNNFSYLADLDIFNLEDKHWTIPIITTKSYLKPRRNHIAELVGNQVFIHGGFDEENNVLNDCHLLNIVPQIKWQKVSLSTKCSPPTLAGHSSCLVIPTDIKTNAKFNVYTYPLEKGYKSKTKRTKEKGIFVFGGKGEKGVLSNEMWIARLGQKPVEWVKAETEGRKPSPRFLHSMNYYEEGNFILIYGGKNDTNNDSIVYNDIFLFEVSRFEWIEIKVFSDSPISVYRRCGHAGFIYGHKLLIFGGMNNENYIGSSLFIINLDSCYNYSNENKHLEDNDKFRMLYMSEISANQKRLKKSKNREFFLNSNHYLPPIK